MRIYFPRQPDFRWTLQKQDCQKITTPAPVDLSKEAPKSQDDLRRDSEVRQALAKTPVQANARAHRFIDQVAAVHRWWTAAAPAKPKAAAPTVTPSASIDKPLEPFDLQDVPDAEEYKGYKLDPALMRQWFSNPAWAVQSPAQKRCVPGTPFYPLTLVDASTLKFEELRKVERIQLAIDKFRSREFLDSKPVRDALYKVCARLPVGYGNDIQPSEECGGDLQRMHRKYAFASITVGKRFPQDLEDIRVKALDTSRLPTDDVALALGDFKLHAAISDAHVFYNGNHTRRVHIKEIAIYIMAPYGFDEFEKGTPYLGHFNKETLALVTDGEWVNSPLFLGNDRYARNAVLRPVSIPLYIQWRQKHKKGGDMLLFSDRLPSFPDIDVEVPLEPIDRIAKPWRISDEGLQFMAVLESGVVSGTNWQGQKVIDGMILKVYDDGYGISTVGMGHKVGTTDGIKLGDTITIEQARSFSRNDLADVEGVINRLVSVPLYQYEYDALVSVLFNTGIFRGKHDSSPQTRSERISDIVNDGDYESASKFLESFIADRVPGRRENEAQLFRTGLYDASH